MARSRDSVERKIHFYRADAGTDDSGIPIPFDPTEALRHIDRLQFDEDGRYHEANANVYCCWVDRAAPRQRLRLAVIRRDGLPYVEEAGAQTALDIPEAAGLVEQIHIMFLPNNVVGCEFNFYGPRMGRLGSYLRDKAGDLCPPVRFEPLLRHDALEQLERLESIRFFRMRIRRPYIEAVEEADENLGAAFRAADQVSDADEVEVILRPTPYSRKSLGDRLLAVTKRLAGREDVDQMAVNFEVAGSTDGGGPQEWVDVLGDALIATKRILRQHPRSRVLDSDSAYTEIREAYNDLKSQLDRASSVAA